MSRTAALLSAVAAVLSAARRENDARLFTDARAELDRYDFADLLKDSQRAPYARVCLLRAKPVLLADGGSDLDLSVAIVVVAGREGRSNPAVASADIAALGLLDGATAALMADPYVGLTKLSAAAFGDQLVVASEQTTKQGLCIALMEVSWTLRQYQVPRPLVRRVLDDQWALQAVALGDGPAEPPPIGWTPPEGSEP
ncbi:hypothetical protein SAMN05428997_1538 [Bosea sp. CRIB-10]|uniref:hypothetical protein n=1 Tax=Bosea sp. CRIB-10 TaxID=378404 RepID=UPI0008EB251C|nr:hypothetical protein [Bosea sp. CRIB-10]SFD76334.1 hypothetical protein SAMN05428997_1538 [Bosea sp. CRIB-10]